MKNKKTSMIVYLAAIGYALLTGFSFVFTKFALEFNEPISILAHRFLFSFITLIVILLTMKKTSYFSTNSFLKIAPLALVYPLLFFGFQTFGLQYASSAEGGILLAVSPVITLILSHFFLKEKASIIQVFSIILSVSGVIYIFYKTSKIDTIDKSSSTLGIIMLIITAICFSIYNVLARKYTSKYKNLELLTVMITIGFIGFNLMLLIKNGFKAGITQYFVPFKNIKYVVSIIYLGVLSTLGTSLLTNYVLSHIEASKMSVFSNLGTLISIVAGAVVLNESVYLFHVIGAACIILGVIGTNFSKSPKDKTKKN